MSNTESGYAKNAANTKDLIIRLKTLDNYQPPKAIYEIKALEELSKRADDANRAVSLVLPTYRKAVDEQELVFKPFNNLVSRSFNYLKAAIANPAELQTAKTLADQLRGIIRNRKDADSTVSRAQKSVSYDNKVENFKQYIDVLLNSNVYTPTEEDITIKSFQSLLQSMEDSINAVAIAKTPVDDARKKRAIVFYAEQTGLIDIVLGVKSYIKASLKLDHPQRKHIIGLTFKKLKV